MCVFVGSGFAIYLSSNSVCVYATWFLKTITASERLSNLQVSIVATAVARPVWRYSGAPNNSGGTRVSCTRLRSTTWGAHFLRFRCVGMALLFLHLPMVVFRMFFELCICPKPLIPMQFSMYIQHCRMSKHKPANYGKYLFPSSISRVVHTDKLRRHSQPKPLFFHVDVSSRCFWTNKILCAGHIALRVMILMMAMVVGFMHGLISLTENTIWSSMRFPNRFCVCEKRNSPRSCCLASVITWIEKEAAMTCKDQPERRSWNSVNINISATWNFTQVRKITIFQRSYLF